MKSRIVLLFICFFPTMHGMAERLARLQVLYGDHIVPAAQENDYEKVKNYLGYGVDVNYVDEDGSTALHWAAHHGNEQMATLLLDRGANVNAACSQTNNELTPLLQAAEMGHIDMMRLLLSRGADLMYQTSGVGAVLHYAYRGGTHSVEFILNEALKRGECDRLRAMTTYSGHTMRDWAVEDLENDRSCDANEVRQCIALYDNPLDEIVRRKTGCPHVLGYLSARSLGLVRRTI